MSDPIQADADDIDTFWQAAPPASADALRPTHAPTGSTRPDTHAPAAPPEPPEPPERFGRYRILRRLGQGGMGSVYLAQDVHLERLVALKVPRFAPEDGPAALERFYREARAAATLDHPNLCPVYDVGEADGIHYLTMAYVEGRPLSDFIRPGKPVPQRQAASIVRKVAQALAEAHRKGIVHRDLKPANIMINHRGEPVVMDFGLARRGDTVENKLTRTGTVVGTPAYMSPEQITGDPAQIGPPCDIYSLGVILYELLVAQTPFDGSTLAVLGLILTQEPPPPSSLRSDLDPALEAICLKALAKRAADRFASMTEFAAALADYLRGQATTATSARPAPVDAVPPAIAAARSAAAHSQPTPPPVPPSTARGIPVATVTDPQARRPRSDAVPPPPPPMPSRRSRRSAAPPLSTHAPVVVYEAEPVLRPKSVEVAVILTIFFGPFGMYYSTPFGALVMLAASFGALISAAFVSVELFICLVVLTGIVSIIWSAAATFRHNRNLW